MARARRKQENHPLQGRLPLDSEGLGSLKPERYDVDPQPSKNGVTGKAVVQEEAGKGAPEPSGLSPLPETQGQAEETRPGNPGHPRREAKVPELVGTKGEEDILVDQFLEQVARIVARGKSSKPAQSNGTGGPA